MELKLETYVHPSLEIEVTIEIRKQVYEKAIELVLVDRIFKLESNNNYLCLLLPCILWSLSSFLSRNINGDYYSYGYTPIAFTELTKNRLSRIGEETTNEFRKKILQEMLNELNNK